MKKQEVINKINEEFRKERGIWNCRGYWGMKKVKTNSLKRLEKLQKRLIDSLVGVSGK